MLQTVQLLCVHLEKRETNSPPRAEGRMWIVHYSTTKLILAIVWEYSLHDNSRRDLTVKRHFNGTGTSYCHPMPAALRLRGLFEENHRGLRGLFRRGPHRTAAFLLSPLHATGSADSFRKRHLPKRLCRGRARSFFVTPPFSAAAEPTGSRGGTGAAAALQSPDHRSRCCCGSPSAAPEGTRDGAAGWAGGSGGLGVGQSEPRPGLPAPHVTRRARPT
ncbi:uncharacterized protein LOC134428001 [Melospiza melodia melodia]|uniref:uncharacterized protein LOC134428001 n=1 Tax=Melospiza melodia melodia TaxID=1914991 RepID=UPI002FD62D62